MCNSIGLLFYLSCRGLTTVSTQLYFYNVRRVRHMLYLKLKQHNFGLYVYIIVYFYTLNENLIQINSTDIKFIMQK